MNLLIGLAMAGGIAFTNTISLPVYNNASLPIYARQNSTELNHKINKLVVQFKANNLIRKSA